MRSGYALFILSVVLSQGILRAQERPPLTPQQQEVWKVSQAWLDAYNHRDLDAFARLTADDFIGATDDGIFMSKAGLLHRLSTHPPEADQRKNVREVRVRVNGDTAVVNYRLSLTEEGFDNAKLIFELRRTEVFQKSNGAWLAVAAHDSLLPVNHREPVKADPKTLRDYAGQYEHFRPGFMATYTVQGDHLIDEWKGDKIEAFPWEKIPFSSAKTWAGPRLFATRRAASRAMSTTTPTASKRRERRSSSCTMSSKYLSPRRLV
jgi:ketosteroid isomerase-like protein